MASTGVKYGIVANEYKQDDKVIAIDFTVKMTDEKGQTTEKTVSMDEDAHKELLKSKKTTLPFDKVVQVLRPFILGKSAEKEIPAAFKILDADNSGSIDIKELAVFLPCFLPDFTEEKLKAHIKKIDVNTDQKMSSAEFTQLCNKGIGIAIIMQ
jgi:Ca2+-binding EF-hand superfamily protein